MGNRLLIRTDPFPRESTSTEMQMAHTTKWLENGQILP